MTSSATPPSVLIQLLGGVMTAGIAVYLLHFVGQIKAMCPRVDSTARTVAQIILWIELIAGVLISLGCVYIITMCGGDPRACGVRFLNGGFPTA